MREEEKESLALEAAAAAVAEGRMREEAAVLKAAMVVGAGVDGDGDSVRLNSDSRSAIWNGTGLIPPGNKLVRRRNLSFSSQLSCSYLQQL